MKNKSANSFGPLKVDLSHPTWGPLDIEISQATRKAWDRIAISPRGPKEWGKITLSATNLDARQKLSNLSEISKKVKQRNDA